MINPNVPIILATGRDTLLSQEEVTKLGIRCFLSKPFRVSELTQKIWELI